MVRPNRRERVLPECPTNHDAFLTQMSQVEGIVDCLSRPMGHEITVTI